MKKGTVFLVGAGPGDNGLITVKGMQAIEKADVILYDRLINAKLLDHAPAGCEFIYCGKEPKCHTLKQEEINQLLVEKALEGKTVVRLKGGDPGIFGRVGEEAAALTEYGISFEMVPGITSGIAAPLYAGIPVTHREYGGSFAVVTAHGKGESGKPSVNWEGLAKGVDTIAFYMGIANLSWICENLVRYGKRPETPVILIQWGTMGRQKVLEGTLETIYEKAKAEQFGNPAITLVGEIVAIRKQLSWFEKKPLFGRQILLARTSAEPSKLARELTEQGADVIEFPKWRAVPAPIDVTILNKIASYDNILFHAPESVHDFFQALIGQGIDVRQVRAKFFGGSIKSVRALRERGFAADVCQNMQEGKLLIVGDSELRKRSSHYTAKYGVHDRFVTSRKQIDERFIPVFQRMLQDMTLDTIIFPSAASVSTFVDEAHQCGLDLEKVMQEAAIICMGSETWQAAEAYGFKPVGMPYVPERGALIECLQQSGM
jgi:uroporphyrinogen III methyltransferase/synthase